MRSNPLTRGGRAVAVTILALAGVACTGDTRDRNDTAAVTEAPPAGVAGVSPVERISVATILAALKDPARWQPYPERVDRLCKGTPGCDAGDDRTEVRLWSDTGTRKLSYADAGDTAILIGKIHNRGGAYTRRYNLAPGRIYAVYLMRDWGTVGGGRYEIWFAEGNTKTPVSAGRYVECNHPDRVNDYSYAVFTNCDHPPELDPVQGGPYLKWKPGRHLGGTGTGARKPFDHEDGPAWFTCKSGCCTTDPQ